MSELTFSHLTASYKDLVVSWLHKPHVAEWFHGDGLNSTLNSIEQYLAGKADLYDHWLGFCDGVPFAFLMTSLIEPDPEDHLNKWHDPNQKAMTLDLLIGEENYLGKGLSVPMIQQFITQHLSDADVVFIDPEATNTKAIHVYQKAGFVKVDEFIASWHPVPHWLMRCVRDKL
ncbi:MAG: GNAT family N-acetyltransferase [Alphaproteobacteria bacterium]